MQSKKKVSLAALSVVAAAGLAMAAQGCLGYPGEDPAECVDFLPVSEAAKEQLYDNLDAYNPYALESGQAADPGEAYSRMGGDLNLLMSTAWTTLSIPVCWEDYAVEDADERAVVREAVERTWEAAFIHPDIPEEKRLKFTGWGPCNGNNNGIRIQVRDTGPHVKALGDYLKNREHGMVLNFTFGEWSTVCASSESYREYCIDAIAVHEFGHALGFAHEQNRIDTPEECTDAPQGSDGDLYLGQWDPNSVMNYCSPRWNNGGDLTEDDIFGVRAVYAYGLLDKWCQEKISGQVYIYDPENQPEEE